MNISSLFKPEQQANERFYLKLMNEVKPGRGMVWAVKCTGDLYVVQHDCIIAPAKLICNIGYPCVSIEFASKYFKCDEKLYNIMIK